MEKIRLLIVDDQELVRESLHIVLDLDPHIEVVGVSEDGQKAIDFCTAQKPDMVLLDIHMPVLNGVEATKIIKTKWPDIKVIILTTFNEFDYVVEALGAGAEGYLLKAIHPQELSSGIRLVHRGGTLIPQGAAQALVKQLQKKEIQTAPAEKNSYSLSDREKQVLLCVSQGLTNKHIAEKLYLSEGTVKNYISTIYSKLDVHDRVQAVRKALDEKLV